MGNNLSFDSLQCEDPALLASEPEGYTLFGTPPLITIKLPLVPSNNPIDGHEKQFLELFCQTKAALFEKNLLDVKNRAASKYGIKHGVDFIPGLGNDSMMILCNRVIKKLVATIRKRDKTEDKSLTRLANENFRDLDTGSNVIVIPLESEPNVFWLPIQCCDLESCPKTMFVDCVLYSLKEMMDEYCGSKKT